MLVVVVNVDQVVLLLILFLSFLLSFLDVEMNGLFQLNQFVVEVGNIDFVREKGVEFLSEICSEAGLGCCHQCFEGAPPCCNITEKRESTKF